MTFDVERARTQVIMASEGIVRNSLVDACTEITRLRAANASMHAEHCADLDKILWAEAKVAELEKKLRVNETEKWIDLHASEKKRAEQAELRAEKLRGEVARLALLHVNPQAESLGKLLTTLQTENERYRKVLHRIAHAHSQDLEADGGDWAHEALASNPGEEST